MTAKRFTLGVCESGLGLTDNETKEQYLEVDDTTLIRLCVLLNELHEENQALLRKNGAMEEEIECLSEENEQLKQRIKELEE